MNKRAYIIIGWKGTDSDPVPEGIYIGQDAVAAAKAGDDAVASGKFASVGQLGPNVNDRPLGSAQNEWKATGPVAESAPPANKQPFVATGPVAEGQPKPYREPFHQPGTNPVLTEDQVASNRKTRLSPVESPEKATPTPPQPRGRAAQDNK